MMMTTVLKMQKTKRWFPSSNTVKGNITCFVRRRIGKDGPTVSPTTSPPDETVEQAEDVMEWLTPEEFLQKYRMSRPAFKWVLNQIEDYEEFTTVGNVKEGRPQAPAVHQWIVFLKHTGTEGAGSNSRNHRQMFGIGQGTADVCRDRVMRAILKLRSSFYGWPDKEERKKLSRKIRKKTGFPMFLESPAALCFHWHSNWRPTMLLATKDENTPTL